LSESVQPEVGELDVAATKKGRAAGRGLQYWLRRAFRWAVIAALVPLVLTLIYLPPVIRPISTLMIADLAMLKGYDRQWVSIDDVAPVMIHSVIMSEDGQFCSHHGIDIREFMKVVTDPRGPSRGASTITMQTVKNLYLWSRPLGSVRKAIELPYAAYVDLVMPKRRIMEIYLNIAEWGPGIYGIEAAAQHHFGVSAKNLSRRQAALLAVTLPNPILRDPAKPSRQMRFLANRVQRLASRSGDYVRCIE
jgi:monofunctional biosynthetic peptidoglycan transglycosylase